MIGVFVFQSALREFMRPKRFLPWVFLGLGTLAMALLWKRFSPETENSVIYGNLSEMLVFRLLGLVSAIYTTAIISQEVEQKTIIYLLTRPVPRWQLLVARYLASVIVVSLITFIAAIFASYGVYRNQFLSNPYLWSDLKAFILGAFAYGALFLVVSLLINRAMIVCLLYAFGWETAVPNMPGESYYTSIFSYLQTLSQHPRGENNPLLGFLSGQLSTNQMSSSMPWLVLPMMTILLLALGCLWFTHFEYVPREDAE